MKKIICSLLIICCFVSLVSSCVYAEYDRDILFNEIPWETTYRETIETLSNKYNVEFTEPTFDTTGITTILYNAEKYGEIPFSTCTQFTVYSLSTINIAELPAVMTLIFYFDNDGNDIKNTKEDVDSAVLGYAKYTFLTSEEEEQFKAVNGIVDDGTERKMAEELKLKLEVLYGEFDERKIHNKSSEWVKNYTVFGIDKNTELVFAISPRNISVEYDDLIKATYQESKKLLMDNIQEWAEQKKDTIKQEKAQKEEEIRNGDKSGL